MKYFAVILLFGNLAVAATFECKNLINLKNVSEAIVTPVKKQKILVSESDEIASFMTETGPDHFVLEAFLPTLQIRIYAEGTIHSAGETLTASAWDRSLMADVVCKKLK